jgi:O-antigen ligase
MTDRVHPWQTLEWWHLVGLVLVTPLDISQVGLIDPNGPDVAKWLLRLPFWYLPIAVLVVRSPRLPDFFRRPPVSWLLVWAGVGSISGLWGLLPVQAVLMGVAILGICLVATWYVTTAGWSAFATAMVVGLTLFVAAGVLVDGINGTLLSERARGLSAGPTTLGRLAAINLVLAAGLWTDRRRRSLVALSVLITAPVLLASGTRTAYAAAAAGLLYGGFRRLSSRQRRHALVLLAASVTAGVALAAQVDGAISFGTRGDPTSVAGRTSIWPVAIEMFLQRPVLGYGAGSAETVYQIAAGQGRLTFLAGTSHSIVLSPLVLGGAVGFSLLAVAAASTVRRRRRVDAWTVAPLVVVMITGLTESIVHLPSIGLVTIAGCLAAIAVAPPAALPATPGLRPLVAGRR